MSNLRSSRVKIASILQLTLGLLSSFAFSRDKPAALQALEDDFKEEVTSRIQALYSPYHDALSRLYTRKLKSGKLNEALAVKMEIERIERAHSVHTVKKIPATAIAGKDGRFLLLPPNADLTGSIRHDKQSGKLIGWNDTGSARWNLDEMPPGSYHVTLNYHSGPFAGGRLQVSAGKTKTISVIKGSGKWQEEKQKRLAEIMVSPPAGTFTLSILDARTLGIMELSSVILTPKKIHNGQGPDVKE